MYTYMHMCPLHDSCENDSHCSWSSHLLHGSVVHQQHHCDPHMQLSSVVSILPINTVVGHNNDVMIQCNTGNKELRKVWFTQPTFLIMPVQNTNDRNSPLYYTLNYVLTETEAQKH